jgi:Cu2+-exporting ATPase
VRALDRRDTMMVGDGLNDAPSIAAALCAATPAVDRPVLPGKADFYFFGDGLAAVRWSLAAARRLRRIVRTNLAIAVAYNAVALALALAGLVTPVVAAILMPTSSVGVVALTAWRLSERRTTWTSS